MSNWYMKEKRTPLHLDPDGLAEQILRVVAQSHTEQSRYEAACKAYAAAHVRYRARKAQEVVKAEGPQGLKEAYAQMLVESEHSDYVVGEVRMHAMRERILTLRAELSALQSLLARQKDGWRAAAAEQKYGT
jgi:hypothetical protein